MNDAGELDQRISIERFSEGGQDGLGFSSETWVTFLTVWANRKDVSDGEKVTTDQRQSALMSRFVIRSNSQAKTVNTKDRLNYENRLWNILGVKETAEGRNRFIEITAVRESD